MGPVSAAASAAPRASLASRSFAEIDGFAGDDHLEAFRVFAQQAAAILERRLPLRPARASSPALTGVFRAALAASVSTQAGALAFFEDHFEAFAVAPSQGFVTGYYEPIVAGALAASAQFTAPVLARPDDLVTLPQGAGLPGRPELAAARRLADRTLVPYPERAEIEADLEQFEALVWLEDSVEVFLVQVQGSARAILPDGRQMRLVYAGRNGWPYTSIGRILIERGEIAPAEMGLAALKTWVRRHGQNPGEDGTTLLHANKSYVFFAIDPHLRETDAAIGGAGVSLTPLRSIAVDRAIWSYGLPFWLDGDLPWKGDEPTPFGRLMIAQDTGSAILGPARADIFFGCGAAAGARAGAVRHACEFIVLLPKPPA
ncbi:MAG: MltA domain-containing protein [Methylovirgula sp.]